MAAQVHFESNVLVGFLNKNAISNPQTKLMSNTWPQCFEVLSTKDKVVLDMTRMCSDQNTEIEPPNTQQTEVLRQTMLKQEEIFKAQVRELHRLYHVQKLLMAEARSRTFDTSPLSSARSETGPPAFQLGSNSIRMDDKPNSWSNAVSGCTGERKSRMDYKSWETSRHSGFACDFLAKSFPARPQDSKNHVQDIYGLQPSKTTTTTRAFDLERPADDYYIVQQSSSSFQKFESLSASFDVCADSDPDVQLTLGTGWHRSSSTTTKFQVEPSPPPQSISSTGFCFAESSRDLPNPSISNEVALFSPISLGNEATYPTKVGAFQSTQDYKGIEDCRVEWQRLDIPYEKSREQHQSLDHRQADDKSGQENLKKPSWLVQALNLNQT